MTPPEYNRASGIASQILDMEKTFSDNLEDLELWNSHYVYNPLNYAAAPRENYINKYLDSTKKTLFLGMNPGPYGMAQNGVPFGDTYYVTKWLRISGEIAQPPNQHPKKQISGFACRRSEVSGSRFWGLMKSIYKTPENFFRDNAVINFCPLLFLDRLSGNNVTPKELERQLKRACKDSRYSKYCSEIELQLEQLEQLEELCQNRLIFYIGIMDIQQIVAIGKYAQNQAELALKEADREIPVFYLRHPSARCRRKEKWEDIAEDRLTEIGVLP